MELLLLVRGISLNIIIIDFIAYQPPLVSAVRSYSYIINGNSTVEF